MAPELAIALDEKKVRKWGRLKFLIADADADVPADFFDVDGTPTIPVTGYLDLGYITTAGASASDSLSTESTQMLQSLEPVRTDLTGREQSLTVAFGEASNAWTNALWHGLAVTDFPATADEAWSYDDGGASDTPYYRIYLIGQDGVGDQAVYKVEFAYRAKVTAKTDRTMNRADAETLGFTFGLFRDPVVGKTLTRATDGPGLVTAGS